VAESASVTSVLPSQPWAVPMFVVVSVRLAEQVKDQTSARSRALLALASPDT
jgi:hypothetical protein